MTNENKRSLIFFSGGLESTFLLYKAVMAGKAITLFSWEHGFNVPGRVAEEHARKKIKEEIRKLAEEKSLPFDVEDFPETGGITFYQSKACESSCYAQLYEHVDMAFYLARTGKFADIHIGLCGSDDTAIHHDRLLEYWKLKCEIFHPHEVEFTPLVLNLGKMFKQQILYELPESLLGKIWVCATPNVHVNETDIDTAFTPCGHCVKCLDHILASTLGDASNVGARREQLHYSAEQTKRWVTRRRNLIMGLPAAYSSDDVVEIIVPGDSELQNKDDPYAHVLNSKTDDVVEIKETL
jgi:hypothetical protein